MEEEEEWLVAGVLMMMKCRCEELGVRRTNGRGTAASEEEAAATNLCVEICWGQ